MTNPAFARRASTPDSITVAQVLVVSLLSCLLGACGGEGVGPSFSTTIQVVSQLEGNGTDPNGFLVKVGADQYGLTPGGSTRIAIDRLGSHTVTLGHVADNCAILGDTSQTVALSADETATVTFAAACFGDLAFQSTRIVHGDLHYMDPTGSFSDMSNGLIPKQLLGWSPDGSRFLFASDSEGDQEIYAVSSDGSALTNITNDPSSDGSARWSPDGSKILFGSVRFTAQGDLFVVNADGTGLVHLTSGADETGLWGGWSPDGSQIVFASLRDGGVEIYVMNADGTNQVNVTNDPGDDLEPQWSPDGTRIGFKSRRDGSNTGLWVMAPDGSGLANIYDEDVRDFLWSPDGSKLLFTDQNDAGDELMVINVDGSGLTNLSHDPAADGELGTWLADGGWVIFASIESGGRHLWAVRPDGSELVRITTGVDWDSSPFVRPR